MMQEALPIKESDLATFGGLAVAVTFIVQGVKKFFPAATPYSKYLALILTYAIGVSSRLTIQGAFGSIGWVYFLIGLFGSAVTSMGIYSMLIQGATGPKPPDRPDEPTGNPLGKPAQGGGA